MTKNQSEWQNWKVSDRVWQWQWRIQWKLEWFIEWMKRTNTHTQTHAYLFFLVHLHNHIEPLCVKVLFQKLKIECFRTHAVRTQYKNRKNQNRNTTIMIISRKKQNNINLFEMSYLWSAHCGGKQIQETIDQLDLAQLSANGLNGLERLPRSDQTGEKLEGQFVW